MSKRTHAAAAGLAVGRASASAESWREPALLAAIATLALAAGCLVYLTDRGLVPTASMSLIAALAGSIGFGALGLWLPSFVHAFSFSLFSAAALPSCARPRYGACLVWAVVNVAFEVGQHPSLSTGLAALVQDRLGTMPPAPMLALYFVHGTFDWSDIAAALLGALAAGAVLRFLSRRQERRHDA